MLLTELVERRQPAWRLWRTLHGVNVRPRFTFVSSLFLSLSFFTCCCSSVNRILFFPSRGRVVFANSPVCTRLPFPSLAIDTERNIVLVSAFGNFAVPLCHEASWQCSSCERRVPVVKRMTRWKHEAYRGTGRSVDGVVLLSQYTLQTSFNIIMTRFMPNYKDTGLWPSIHRHDRLCPIYPGGQH